MEMENAPIQEQGKKSYYNQVTTLSKVLSAILFIALPFGGFWLGKEYSQTEFLTIEDDIKVSIEDSYSQETVEESEKQVLENSYIENPATTNESDLAKETISWINWEDRNVFLTTGVKQWYEISNKLDILSDSVRNGYGDHPLFPGDLTAQTDASPEEEYYEPYFFKRFETDDYIVFTKKGGDKGGNGISEHFENFWIFNKKTKEIKNLAEVISVTTSPYLIDGATYDISLISNGSHVLIVDGKDGQYRLMGLFLEDLESYYENYAKYDDYVDPGTYDTILESILSNCEALKNCKETESEIFGYREM